MANRGILDHVAMDSSGNIRANKAVTITKADGSAFDGVLYDAVSGGSVVLAPTTNPLGLLKVWTTADKAQRIKVTVDGDVGATDSDFRLDPSELFYSGMTRTGTLAGALTVAGTLTAGGYVGPFASGLAVTKNADSYALTSQNTHANGKALAVLDVDGNNMLAARRIGTTDVVSVNTPDAYMTGTSSFVVLDTKSSSHVMADFQFDSTGTAGTDSGAIRGIVRQPSGSTALRAVEAQAIRQTGTGPNDTWGIEVGVHAQVAGTNPGMNVGVKILSSHAGWLASGLRNNTGIILGGEDGWDDGIRYYDTDGATVLFRVAGGSLAGDTAGDLIAPGRHITNIGFTALEQASAPATPAAGYRIIYPSTADDHLRQKTEAGTVIALLDATSNAVVPQCQVKHTSAQSINNTTATALAFATEVYDSSAFHDNAVNNSRLTIPTTGRYRVYGMAAFSNNATGYRILSIRKNGAANVVAIDTRQPINGDATVMTIEKAIDLSGGDYVELFVYQSSGGALNVEGTAPYEPYLGIQAVV